MRGPKDAPAKALVWKQSRKPDRDGHKHYQAKTAAGCYSVAAEYQPGKGFIGYRVTQSVADKRRVIASSITVDEGKGNLWANVGLNSYSLSAIPLSDYQVDKLGASR